jgi:cell division septum initiation protein DivIVA
MNLLVLLTFGLFGRKIERSVGDIVGTFTKVREELEQVIVLEELAIEKAKDAKILANKVADKAIDIANAKANMLVEKANAKAKKVIDLAKAKAKEAKQDAIYANIISSEDNIKIVTSAKKTINVANEWISKIPSVD